MDTPSSLASDWSSTVESCMEWSYRVSRHHYDTPSETIMDILLSSMYYTYSHTKILLNCGEQTLSNH